MRRSSIVGGIHPDDLRTVLENNGTLSDQKRASRRMTFISNDLAHLSKKVTFRDSAVSNSLDFSKINKTRRDGMLITQ